MLDLRPAEEILSRYGVGRIVRTEPLAAGTVQHSTKVTTEQGDYVLRLYRNRSLESVRFECRLLSELASRGFPCIPPLPDRDGHVTTVLRDRPAVLFPFVDGEHFERLEPERRASLIGVVVRLHTLTMGRKELRSPDRWNYDLRFCEERLRAAAAASPRSDATERLVFLLGELETVDIPENLAEGVCHCDLCQSNVLFSGSEVAALLDFDDANYTWLAYDLVNLIDFLCWPLGGELSWEEGRDVVRSYRGRRELTPGELEHLYDIHRFQIVLDAAWFFDRGTAAGFPERRKLEYLRTLGRARYREELGLY